MRGTFRPLPVWPYEATPSHQRRSGYTFKAPWSDTLRLIDYEVDRLRGHSVIIAAGFSERDIRLDGLPRSDAREPSHPGVEISFDTTRHGRLVYHTDTCARWQHNVRSIGLGLEALRKVDLYGITQTGQQYAGWRELPAGAGRGVVIAGMDEAWEILTIAADVDGAYDHNDISQLREVYRAAAKRVHPDQGGTDEAFLRVRAAYELLKGAAA